jgi:hypothetical protein
MFLEKYNVAAIGQPPKDGVYPNQTGFGWTNAVFVYLVNHYLPAGERPVPVPITPMNRFETMLRESHERFVRLGMRLRA